MKKPENYLKTTIEDIVFENRNKSYGAYQLRHDTDRFLKIGLLIGAMFVTIISAYSLTSKKSVITSIDPIIYDTIVFENVEVEKYELPKPPKVETPPAVTQPTAQQRFLELAMVDDKLPVSDAPHLDDLNPEIPIGLNDIEGPEGPIVLDEPDIATGGTGIEVKDDFILLPEQMPEYVGGYIAMQKFLMSQIDYPTIAKSREIEGTVYMSFIINRDGSVSDVTVVRGIGFGCDEEAIQAVSKMKNWIPGKQNNAPVRVKMTIPIKFEIAD